MNCKPFNRAKRSGSGTGILPVRLEEQRIAGGSRPQRTGWKPVPLQQGGFTLAEVLAAMLFMAIVIPVAVGALRIASLAGTVATRKAVAARVADRILNEMIVTGQVQKNAQSGKVQEGPIEYSWTMNIESSALDTLRLATVNVTFPAQGKEYDVKVSTLVGAQ